MLCHLFTPNKVEHRVRLYIDHPDIYRDHPDFVHNRFKSVCDLYSLDSSEFGDVDDKNILNIFRGYALIKFKPEEEARGNDIIDTAVEELRKDVDKANCDLGLKDDRDEYEYSLCYPYYHLAQGLAMQNKKESRDGAKGLLNYLLTSENDFSFVKEWAKAADCSDFIAIKDDPGFREIVGLDRQEG